MNHTEQLKKIFNDRCAEFLEFHNKDKEDKATHIDHQEVRSSIFHQSMKKLSEDNPDTKKFVIDYDWMFSIVPKTEVKEGSGDGIMVEQMHAIIDERYSFIKDLTTKEEQEFRIDEKKLRDTEIELVRKYNNIVSKRLTHETCINYILDMVNLAPKEKIEKYYTMTEHKYDGEGGFPKFSKDFQEILVKRLKQSTNEELGIIIDVLRLIDLPEKKA